MYRGIIIYDGKKYLKRLKINSLDDNVVLRKIYRYFKSVVENNVDKVEFKISNIVEKRS